MTDQIPPYNVADLDGDVRRTAPAAARNVAPIGELLEQWLPSAGTILEIASGTGEHALAFARRFPALDWQPSDPDTLALASIAAWQDDGPSNLRAPLRLDAAEADWPVKDAAAILCINMVHISPWTSALGLLDGAARLVGGRRTADPLWAMDRRGCRNRAIKFGVRCRSQSARFPLGSAVACRVPRSGRTARAGVRRMADHAIQQRHAAIPPRHASAGLRPPTPPPSRPRTPSRRSRRSASGPRVRGGSRRLPG